MVTSCFHSESLFIYLSYMDVFIRRILINIYEFFNNHSISHKYNRFFIELDLLELVVLKEKHSHNSSMWKCKLSIFPQTY